MAALSSADRQLTADKPRNYFSPASPIQPLLEFPYLNWTNLCHSASQVGLRQSIPFRAAQERSPGPLEGFPLCFPPLHCSRKLPWKLLLLLSAHIVRGAQLAHASLHFSLRLQVLFSTLKYEWKIGEEVNTKRFLTKHTLVFSKRFLPH